MEAKVRLGWASGPQLDDVAVAVARDLRSSVEGLAADPQRCFTSAAAIPSQQIVLGRQPADRTLGVRELALQLRQRLLTPARERLGGDAQLAAHLADRCRPVSTATTASRFWVLVDGDRRGCMSSFGSRSLTFT
jgi:hypothetical protein